MDAGPMVGYLMQERRTFNAGATDCGIQDLRIETLRHPAFVGRTKGTHNRLGMACIQA
jgi:hypothetical protein